MEPVYAREPLPTACRGSLFLAGPTPRRAEVPSWRPAALALLAARGWEGVVFVPEDRDGRFPAGEYEAQIDWERAALDRADVILFWIPRDLERLPGFTTNVEFGAWARSGRAVLGAPPGAPGLRYLRAVAAREGVPQAESLEGTVEAALRLAGAGAPRRDGECAVPLPIWSSPTFQAWHTAQRGAGNALRGARVEWALPGPAGRLFLWALRVDVEVAAEGRRKRNEVVLGRPDLATVVLLRPQPDDPRAGEVALVREFRSAGATADGYVRECPGGSSWGPEAGDMVAVALAEVAEETGLRLGPERLVPLGARQQAATLLAHRAHAFAVALTAAEVAALRARAGQVLGADDGERTTVEVWTVRDLLASPGVDWTTLGLVLTALEALRPSAGSSATAGAGA